MVWKRLLYSWEIICSWFCKQSNFDEDHKVPFKFNLNCLNWKVAKHFGMLPARWSTREGIWGRNIMGLLMGGGQRNISISWKATIGMTTHWGVGASWTSKRRDDLVKNGWKDKGDMCTPSNIKYYETNCKKKKIAQNQAVSRPAPLPPTWLYLALATCLVSILPYWGGLQENSTKSSSCSKMAGYMTCRFSGPTQMACSREGTEEQTLLTSTTGLHIT